MINNIFDVLKNLTNIKKEEDLGSKFYNPYIINKYLSMNEKYLIYGFLMNRYSNIPKEYQEMFLYHIIPKNYVFLKYIKKNKDDKNFSEEINKLSKQLEISEKKAEQLIEFYYQLQERKNGEF